MGGRYSADNDKARVRLLAVTSRLTDTDLSRPVETEWTIGNVLVHLAFWDRFTLARVEQWEQAGFVWAPSNVDGINDTIEFLSAGFAARAAIDLVRTAAEQLDRKLETISAEFEYALDTDAHRHFLRRSIHRDYHLAQIERALELSP